MANSVPQNRPIVQFDTQTQSLAQLRDGQSGGLIKDNPTFGPTCTSFKESHFTHLCKVSDNGLFRFQ